MKPSIKEKWIAALRSGDYEQGTEVLHKEDKFCCLGVLCDLYLKEHDAEWVEKEIYETGTYSYHCLDNDEVLPPVVQEWAGLKESDPMVDTQSLSYYNDYMLDPFEDIAKLIKENL